MKSENRIFISLLLLCCLVLSGCSAKENEEKAEDIKIISSENPEEEIKETVVADGATKNGIKIAIDPGHQGESVDMTAQEPNAPDSSEMKTKASTGTAGSYTGIAEYQLVLDISLMVRDELEAQGYEVIMTREDNDTAISNAERATLANESGANVMVRIHANSSDDTSASGALALVSSESNPYIGDRYQESYQLADTILQSYCQETGMENDGIQENDSMTGINWSTIPVMILEMGFMSNESDDYNMADPSFRKQMVTGIVKGINTYFGQQTNGEHLTDLDDQINQLSQEAIAQGEKWSVYVKDLSNGNYSVVGNQKMQSASIIKLFVAGTVYENLDAVNAVQAYDGETQELIKAMISQSDNDATNELVTRLGSGDATAGLAKINEFCNQHGYLGTHMGRLMLASNETDDNYTTVQDVGCLLETYYRNEMSGSEDILAFMKEQERTTKIPAGLPEGIEAANKTGELSDVENDVALVTANGKTYIICVMSNNVQAPQRAVEQIRSLSSLVYNTLMQ